MLDDRDQRPGSLLIDSELIGIPHRIAIGEKSLAKGQVEYQFRRDLKIIPVDKDAAAQFLAEKIDQGE